MSETTDTSTASRWFDFLIKAVFPFLVGLAAWGVLELRSQDRAWASLDKRLSIVETQLDRDHEENKARDAQRAEVAKALGEIKESLSSLGATMTAEQKALQARLARIEARLPK